MNLHAKGIRDNRLYDTHRQSRRRLTVIAGQGLISVKSALVCAPAAALTLLSGYEGVAGTVEAKGFTPMYAAESMSSEAETVTSGRDEYADWLTMEAFIAVAEQDAAKLESLFSRSVQENGALAGEIDAMFDFMHGEVMSHEDICRYTGARSMVDGELVYEYMNTFVSGIRTTRSGLYELRLAIFWNGRDSEKNRGLATASIFDATYGQSHRGKPCCANVGYMPIC